MFGWKRISFNLDWNTLGAFISLSPLSKGLILLDYLVVKLSFVSCLVSRPLPTTSNTIVDSLNEYMYNQTVREHSISRGNKVAVECLTCCTVCTNRKPQNINSKHIVCNTIYKSSASKRNSHFAMYLCSVQQTISDHSGLFPMYLL